jgi:magnesium-transporting ATPase (P-type)
MAEKTKKATVSELFRRLSSSENGLSDAEARKRIQEYGYNEIPEKKKNPLLKFLKYFWGPIPWMIEVAAILSAYICATDVPRNGDEPFELRHSWDDGILWWCRKVALGCDCDDC